MKENKENIKILTKEDIIALSNDKKRRIFLKSYHKWGPWLEIPQLRVQVYKAVLPENECIFITEYLAHFDFTPAIYRYAPKNELYSTFWNYESNIAAAMKAMRAKYCEERRKGATKNEL